jgi:hypothetical protein
MRFAELQDVRRPVSGKRKDARVVVDGVASKDTYVVVAVRDGFRVCVRPLGIHTRKPVAVDGYEIPGLPAWHYMKCRVHVERDSTDPFSDEISKETAQALFGIKNAYKAENRVSAYVEAPICKVGDNVKLAYDEKHPVDELVAVIWEKLVSRSKTLPVITRRELLVALKDHFDTAISYYG